MVPLQYVWQFQSPLWELLLKEHRINSALPTGARRVTGRRVPRKSRVLQLRPVEASKPPRAVTPSWAVKQNLPDGQWMDCSEVFLLAIGFANFSRELRTAFMGGGQQRAISNYCIKQNE